jgi:hypothetical protein
MADKFQLLGTSALLTDEQKEAKLAPVKNKTVDKYEIRDIPTLKKENSNLIKDIRSDKNSTLSGIAMQRKINRGNVASARDTNLVVDSANRAGVNLNQDYGYPVTDDKKKSIAEGLSPMVNDVDTFMKYAGTHPDPNFVTPPTINTEEEKRKARRERAAKWADALYAFGEGLQGRTADKNNMASTKMQQKRDELFQNYKNASEANKQTAKNWEYNYRKDLMDWIDKQLESERLSEAERRKYKLEYDKLGQQQKQHEEEIGLKGKELGLQGRELDMKEKEQKERIGDENITFQTSGGQTISKKIPLPEQRDIISRAKMNPKFHEYAEKFMGKRAITTFDQEGQRQTQLVDEMGKNISDRDLLQAYLRWSSEGAPNENYGAPGIGETIPTESNAPTQQTTTLPSNQKIDPLDIDL